MSFKSTVTITLDEYKSLIEQAQFTSRICDIEELIKDFCNKDFTRMKIEEYYNFKKRAFDLLKTDWFKNESN